VSKNSSENQNNFVEKNSVANNCVFCNIVAGTLKAALIAESSDLIVIQDIRPKAPIHYLIIPKKHIDSLCSITQSDISLMGSIMLMAQKLACDNEEMLDFRLLTNNGAGAGQSVFHLHFHFLAGMHMSDF